MSRDTEEMVACEPCDGWGHLTVEGAEVWCESCDGFGRVHVVAWLFELAPERPTSCAIRGR